MALEIPPAKSPQLLLTIPSCYSWLCLHLGLRHLLTDAILQMLLCKSKKDLRSFPHDDGMIPDLSKAFASKSSRDSDSSCPSAKQVMATKPVSDQGIWDCVRMLYP